LGSAAIGINNSGEIIGTYSDLDGSHVYIDDNGAYTLPLLPANTHITALNDNGQIVGSYSDGFHSHGLIYANGSYITIDFSSAQNTLLEGINSSGQVVG
jgi:uncharacterized membrane protein